MRWFGSLARLIRGQKPESAPAGGPWGQPHGRSAFSFVVDADPKSAFQGYHLAHSLLEHCVDKPAFIHVQVTPEVEAWVRRIFIELGCTVHEIKRFGDGRYCNKIAQFENLQDLAIDCVVLLDTDTIVLADIRPFLAHDALQAKVVDLANPSLSALQEIARLAGMRILPKTIPTDAGRGKTYLGNCNGGFYAIPTALIPLLSAEWRRWTVWLLDNAQPLRREGKQVHVDQVSMWLALHMAGIPYRPAPSNVNYYIHFAGSHRYYDPTEPIALLHYHDSSLNVVGQIEPKARVTGIEAEAVKRANTQINRHFDNNIFWGLRYAHFPERGSGLGSRGRNAAYKRELLVQEGITAAAGILDVGCGDLEVLRAFDIPNYLGLDQSEPALKLARQARPDWEFRIFDLTSDADAIPAKDWVLCFEVLIHQETEDRYRKLIQFIGDKALRTLIVSGYGAAPKGWQSNHMIFFHEPLELSLRRTGRFRSVRKVGEHTDVTVFRCDV